MVKMIYLVLISFAFTNSHFGQATKERESVSTINKSLRSKVIESLQDDFCLTDNCPRGDYDKCCTSCSFDPVSDSLTCQCKTTDGIVKTSTMKWCNTYTAYSSTGAIGCSSYKTCISASCRSGSYLNSCHWCNDFSSDFTGTIRCSCTPSNGLNSQAIASEFKGPCQNLINKDGYLRCMDPCIGGSDKCRAGSYSSSCVSCRESSPDFKGTLQCSCGLFYSYAGSYSGPCSSLRVGDWGQLICPVCPNNNCPSGDYTSSCVDCQYDSTTKTLSCFCKSSTSAWSDRISITGNCDNIANKNGQLYCKSACPSMNCMNGPYLTSCNNCSIFFGILKCSCPKNDGTYLESSIPPCAGSIVNVDGVLTCI